MARLLGKFVKTALERRQYAFDYSNWLNPGETLLSFNASVIGVPANDDSPLVVDAVFLYPDSSGAFLYVYGGSEGAEYAVRMLASTSLTQVKEDGILVKVVPSVGQWVPNCICVPILGPPGPPGPRGPMGLPGSPGLPGGTDGGLATVYYQATTGQTVFPLTTPDVFGETLPLNAGNIHVYRNGTLLMPDNGGLAGGYTVDGAMSQVTLLWPAGAGEIIAVQQYKTLDLTPRMVTEPLTITGTNAFAPLAHAWDGDTAIMFLNRMAFTAPSDFTIVGNVINWTNTSYSVTTYDSAVLYYSH